MYGDARVGARFEVRGGRGVERSADRRRERGDGPLILGRRLAKRRASAILKPRRAIRRRGPFQLQRQANECPARRRPQRRRSAGLARLSLVRASARSSAGREASRLTASSALTRASWAPSAVLATERSAALAGSGWASRATTRFFKSASAARDRRAPSATPCSPQPRVQAFAQPARVRLRPWRAPRARCAVRPAQRSGRRVHDLLRPVVRQRALSANRLRARNDVRLDVRLLAASVVIPHGVFDVIRRLDRIGAIAHGDAGLGAFPTLWSRELALLGASSAASVASRF